MKTIFSNNTKIHYRIEGKGKAIVFLHGVGRNHTSWRPFFDHFESLNYKTITPDLRGSGNSKTYNITMDDYAKDIKNILKKENITKAAFVGHCLGASIAIKFNELYPEYVDKLVLLGIFTKKTLRFYHMIKFVNNMFYYPAALLNKLGLRRSNLNYLDYSDYKKLPLILSPFLDFKGNSFHNWLRSAKVLLDYNPELTFNKPHLAIFAGKDFFVDNKRLKNSKVIKGLDHVMVLRKPKILIREIEDFVNG